MTAPYYKTLKILLINTYWLCVIMITIVIYKLFIDILFIKREGFNYLDLVEKGARILKI